MQAPHPLEGTWLPLKAELSGEAAPEMVLSKTLVVLRTGTYNVSFGREVADRGTYIVDAAHHEHLTLTGVAGTNAGRRIPCIFQLAGNRLRICYGLDGVRPDTFATREGDQRYLVTYRRIEATHGTA